MVKRYPFDPLIEAVAITRDMSSLISALQTFAQEHGFHSFAYLHVNGSRCKAVSDYPEDWQDCYVRHAYSRIDPIITAAKRGAHPFCWSLDDDGLIKDRRDLCDFRDQAIGFGIRAGLSIPIRTGFSCYAILTFAASGLSDAHAAWTMDIVQAAAAVALLHAAFSLSQVSTSPALGDQLTACEVLCLRWAAEGKSMQDIADLLQIKYSTVRFRIDKAREKLDAVNLQQATALAVKMMLI